MDGFLIMLKIISSKKYNEMQLKIEAQAALLSNQRCVIDEQNTELDKSEKEKHNLVEQMRYTLQAAVSSIEKAEVDTGQLENLAESLPYLLSGFRHWDEGEINDIGGSVRVNMGNLAEKYNFELPSSGYDAVMAMLDLSISLIYPSNTWLIESLQRQYPVTKEGNSNE